MSMAPAQLPCRLVDLELHRRGGVFHHHQKPIAGRDQVVVVVGEAAQVVVPVDLHGGRGAAYALHGCDIPGVKAVVEDVELHCRPAWISVYPGEHAELASEERDVDDAGAVAGRRRAPCHRRHVPAYSWLAERDDNVLGRKADDEAGPDGHEVVCHHDLADVAGEGALVEKGVFVSIHKCL